MCVESDVLFVLLKQLPVAASDASTEYAALKLTAQAVTETLTHFTRADDSCAALLDSGAIEAVCDVLAIPRDPHNVKLTLLDMVIKLARDYRPARARLATPAVLDAIITRIRCLLVCDGDTAPVALKESGKLVELVATITMTPAATAAAADSGSGSGASLLSTESLSAIVAALRLALATALPRANDNVAADDDNGNDGDDGDVNDVDDVVFGLIRAALTALVHVFHSDPARFAADIEAVATSDATEFVLRNFDAFSDARVTVPRFVCLAASMGNVTVVERVFTAPRVVRLRTMSSRFRFVSHENWKVFNAFFARLVSVSPALAQRAVNAGVPQIMLRLGYALDQSAVKLPVLWEIASYTVQTLAGVVSAAFMIPEDTDSEPEDSADAGADYKAVLLQCLVDSKATSFVARTVMACALWVGNGSGSGEIAVTAISVLRRILLLASTAAENGDASFLDAVNAEYLAARGRQAIELMRCADCMTADCTTADGPVSQELQQLLPVLERAGLTATATGGNDATVPAQLATAAAAAEAAVEAREFTQSFVDWENALDALVAHGLARAGYPPLYKYSAAAHEYTAVTHPPLPAAAAGPTAAALALLQCRARESILASQRVKKLERQVTMHAELYNARTRDRVKRTFVIRFPAGVLPCHAAHFAVAAQKSALGSHVHACFAPADCSTPHAQLPFVTVYSGSEAIPCASMPISLPLRDTLYGEYTVPPQDDAAETATVYPPGTVLFVPRTVAPQSCSAIPYYIAFKSCAAALLRGAVPVGHVRECARAGEVASDGGAGEHSSDEMPPFDGEMRAWFESFAQLGTCSRESKKHAASTISYAPFG